MTLYGTWFWGFTPETLPFFGFTYEGSRNNLQAVAKRGDKIAVVGTITNEHTAPEDRGRLLGLYEIGFEPFNANEMLEFEDKPAHLFDERGLFRWPYALPATRAWKFNAPPLIDDLIGRNLRQSARTGYDQFSPEEESLVEDLAKTEVVLPQLKHLRKAERQTYALGHSAEKDAAGQPGPPPSEWSALVSRSDGPTATYLMQYGKHAVWKIGISQNPKERLKALNFPLPTRFLECQWELRRFQLWKDGASAFQMEQFLLDHLAQFSVGSEQLHCERSVLEKAWDDYIIGNLGVS